MVIKKIIKAAAKKGLKSKKKTKVRLPPRPKSAKMKKAQVSLADRKRAAAMAHVRKLEKQGHTKAANKARAWIQQGDAFRRGSGTKKDFNVWAKKAKTLGPSRERIQPRKTLQDKEIFHRRPSPAYEEHKLGWRPEGTPPTGMAKRSIENKLHKWRQGKIPSGFKRRDPQGTWRKSSGIPVEYGSFGPASKPGWAKGFGKKPVRKAPRTVAGLDRDDWFVAGLAGAGPAIGAAYWENKEKINKLPGNAIDVIRDRRDAILRRLGLI